MNHLDSLGWTGKPMSKETCFELYQALANELGAENVRLAVEAICPPILETRTVLNQEDAEVTLENLKNAKKES